MTNSIYNKTLLKKINVIWFLITWQLCSEKQILAIKALQDKSRGNKAKQLSVFPYKNISRLQQELNPRPLVVLICCSNN